MFDVEECRVALLTECTCEVTYLGGRMLLRYGTQSSHGDKIRSVYLPESDDKLPYWCYLRNIRQINIDKSTESLFMSIKAMKPRQWSDIVTLVADPKHSRFACLGDWYPSIKIEKNKVSYHNIYTKKECILYDFQLLNWQSF